MKKLVISGSTKLYERALYWRGYFEGRGYEVIDWPRPLYENDDLTAETQFAPGLPPGRLLGSNDASWASEMTKFYQQFYKHLDQTDTFFLMNEDRNNIEGYIGPNAFAELAYVVVGNLNRGRKVDIQILKMPAKTQSCYDEVKFWLDQDLLHIYRRPTGKKATIPVPDDTPATEMPAVTPGQATEVTEDTAETISTTVEPEVAEPAPRRGFFNRDDRMIDITTCTKRCLSSLSPEMREFMKILSPEFPAWLLKYIAAPEMQRLAGISDTSGLCHTSLYQFKRTNSTLTHSIGVALLTWRFTHDRKQTLAGLFHDIAAPAFKHAIDYMNGDAETQESTEARTEQVIRNSRTITKLLKRDGILPSEVADDHLYPLVNSSTPNLCIDRLEYTLSNGYFLYDIWTLSDIKMFASHLAILKNEDGVSEVGFNDAEIAADFTVRNLALAAIYHGEKSRANMQFLADITHSMIVAGYLTVDDLYVMSEREIIDWILSCGDKTLAEVFRQYQRATSVISGNTMKKNCYCVPAGYKVRYIVPLVKGEQEDEESIRIAKLNRKVNQAIQEYLDTKQPKYVGFDFEFEPYTE